MTTGHDAPTEPRRAYVRPELRDYGTMRELTAGGSGQAREGSGQQGTEPTRRP